MLGKLLKHEFHATGKILPISYLGVVVLFLVGWMFKLIFKDILAATIIPIILLVLGTIFLFIFTYVVIIMRFYRSMYGREGYLTQTLPVSKSALLSSRIIVFVTWLIATTIVVLFACAGIAFLALDADPKQFFEIIQTLYGTSPTMFLYLLVAMIASTLLFAFEVFFSISLANTSKFLKNNIAFSVVFLLITYIIVELFGVVAMLFIPLTIVIDPITGGATWSTHTMFEEMKNAIVEGINSATADPGATTTISTTTNAIGVGSIFTSILFIIVLFFLTKYLMKHKINIK